MKINLKNTTLILGDSWKSESVYFKAGNYLQDNNPSPVTSGLKAIYNIKVF
ncbi:polysaccharide lyase family 7 protein [Chryseobacterium sp. MEBOG07]|uniref:polysaccharide lyase family 7 protein n=1 Tax=Chryseobacterium sp. MEBOG07 TaxID=2879939 RepID=UPI001F36E2F9|nr:polysaccharide lyase family 7 protein [Chryseobacterium sp. MEBOG07]UKB81630.1 polysaccharide lyase family 7 protein [Chryseobacterium sp. MEBOG07]